MYSKEVVGSLGMGWVIMNSVFKRSCWFIMNGFCRGIFVILDMVWVISNGLGHGEWVVKWCLGSLGMGLSHYEWALKRMLSH